MELQVNIRFLDRAVLRNFRVYISIKRLVLTLATVFVLLYAEGWIHYVSLSRFVLNTPFITALLFIF